MKTICVRLADNEEKMLNDLKQKYSEVNKGIKITDSLIIRISLIHEYENNKTTG